MADPNERLPALIREVTEAGLRINNLFHRADGRCQANLRSKVTPAFFEWGYGRTFVEALETALEKARGGKLATKATTDDQGRAAVQIGIVKEPVAPVVADPLDDLLG